MATLLKKTDIPFYFTGHYLTKSVERLRDKCDGTPMCLDKSDPNFGCLLDGKHLNRKEKCFLVSVLPIVTPFVIVFDVVNIASFPVFVGYRLCK